MSDSDNDLSISINGVSHPVRCGTCKEKIAFIGEPDVETGEAGCAPCGNVADVKEVARIATEYAKDEAQLIINRMARDTARKSKIMTFSGQTEHDKAHRFIVTDLQF
jgi:hypothetical protein